MKNFQKFAAQQLTKKQMNEVRGGKQWMCFVDGQWIGAYIIADDKKTAEAYIKNRYGSGYCTETKADSQPGLA